MPETITVKRAGCPSLVLTLCGGTTMLNARALNVSVATRLVTAPAKFVTMT